MNGNDRTTFYLILESSRGTGINADELYDRLPWSSLAVKILSFLEDPTTSFSKGPYFEPDDASLICSDLNCDDIADNREFLAVFVILGLRDLPPPTQFPIVQRILITSDQTILLIGLVGI